MRHATEFIRIHRINPIFRWIRGAVDSKKCVGPTFFRIGESAIAGSRRRVFLSLFFPLEVRIGLAPHSSYILLGQLRSLFGRSLYFRSEGRFET